MATTIVKPGGIIANIPCPELENPEYALNCALTIELTSITMEDISFADHMSCDLRITLNYLDVETGANATQVLAEVSDFMLFGA